MRRVSDRRRRASAYRWGWGRRLLPAFLIVMGFAISGAAGGLPEVHKYLVVQ
jgi:hypothetical protein